MNPATTLVGAGSVPIASETRGPASDAAAPPIVATTGWANDRSVWAPMVDDLCSDHLITTGDLRGYGASGAPPLSLIHI